VCYNPHKRQENSRREGVSAHVNDDDYFSRMVLDDINLIIRDIREAHKKDSESAPRTTVADELKENLDAVKKFKGSRLEKQAMLYCKQQCTC